MTMDAVSKEPRITNSRNSVRTRKKHKLIAMAKKRKGDSDDLDDSQLHVRRVKRRKLVERNADQAVKDIWDIAINARSGADKRHSCHLSLDQAQPLSKMTKTYKDQAGVSVEKLPGVLSEQWEVDSGFSSEASQPASGRSSPCLGLDPSKVVSLDCEMVGTGPDGHRSELARCSIVNYCGSILYDKYVLPQRPVTNYRTPWSGIQEHHLTQAIPFEDAKREIRHILTGKVVIGHALHNDFRVLGFSLPRHMIRDTSHMCLLHQMYGGSGNGGVSLKKLALKLLHRKIQVSRMGHCSVEDARAALDLYKLVEEEWEKDLQPVMVTSLPLLDSSLSPEHYMQDQYWPEDLMDCSQ